MQKNLLKLITLILFFGAAISHQKAYSKGNNDDKITLSNGTVVHGEIIGARKNFNKSITMIKSDKKKVNYQVSEITSIELSNGLFFESALDVSKETLPQVLAKGELTLYRLGNTYYIRDQAGELIKLQDPSAVEQKNLNLSVRNLGIISKLMEGPCNKTEEYLQKKFILNDEFLVSLFEEYHKCIGVQANSFYYNTPNMRISPMIGAGLNFQSNYGYDDATGINYTLPNTPMFLVGVRIMEVRKLSERLSLDIQVGFSNSSQKLMAFFENNTRSFTANQEYNLQSINIPITVNYNIFHRKNSAVFIGLGGNYRINKMNTNQAIIDNFEKATGYSFLENVEISSISGGNLSATAKIGSMVKIAGKSRLWLEASATNNANTQSIFIASHQSKHNKFISNLTLGVSF